MPALCWGQLPCERPARAGRAAGVGFRCCPSRQWTQLTVRCHTRQASPDVARLQDPQEARAALTQGSAGQRASQSVYLVALPPRTCVRGRHCSRTRSDLALTPLVRCLL